MQKRNSEIFIHVLESFEITAILTSHNSLVLKSNTKMVFIPYNRQFEIVKQQINLMRKNSSVRPICGGIIDSKLKAV